MSLMSKLLVTSLSLSSILFLSACSQSECVKVDEKVVTTSSTTVNKDVDKQVIAFLQKGIGSNPNIISLDIKIVSKIALDSPKDWEAFIIQMSGKAKGPNGTTQDISQRSIYFAGGGTITTDLYDITTGDKLSNSVSPKFSDKFYDDEHLLFGNKDAAHKVVIFSDPLCPFCRTFVPEALSYMKKSPETFAVYYYHFPLASLHPAAITLVKAAYVAESKGTKNVVEGLYKVQVNGREANQQVIVDSFNKAMNTNITLADIAASDAQTRLAHDMNAAEVHLVNGTPTVFFDGAKDNSKTKYKSVKIIK